MGTVRWPQPGLDVLAEFLLDRTRGRAAGVGGGFLTNASQPVAVAVLALAGRRQRRRHHAVGDRRRRSVKVSAWSKERCLAGNLGDVVGWVGLDLFAQRGDLVEDRADQLVDHAERAHGGVPAAGLRVEVEHLDLPGGAVSLLAGRARPYRYRNNEEMDQGNSSERAINMSLTC